MKCMGDFGSGYQIDTDEYEDEAEMGFKIKIKKPKFKSFVPKPVSKIASNVIKAHTSVLKSIVKPASGIASQVIKPSTNIIMQATKPVSQIATQVAKPATQVLSSVTKPITQAVATGAALATGLVMSQPKAPKVEQEVEEAVQEAVAPEQNSVELKSDGQAATRTPSSSEEAPKKAVGTATIAAAGVGIAALAYFMLAKD